MPSTRTSLVALAGLSLTGALVAAPPAQAVVVKQVTMTNSMTFSPATLTIKRGTTVKWVNSSFVSHTTTSNKGLWKATVPPGRSYSRTFTKVGTFGYRCTIHPMMVGKIIVKA